MAILVNDNVKLSRIQAPVVKQQMTLNVDNFETNQLYQNNNVITESVNNVVKNLNHKHFSAYSQSRNGINTTYNNGNTLQFNNVVSDPFDIYDSTSNVITSPITGLLLVQINGYTVNAGMDLRINLVEIDKDVLPITIYRSYFGSNSYSVCTNHGYFTESGNKFKLVIQTTSAVTLPWEFQLNIVWG